MHWFTTASWSSRSEFIDKIQRGNNWITLYNRSNLYGRAVLAFKTNFYFVFDSLVCNSKYQPWSDCFDKPAQLGDTVLQLHPTKEFSLSPSKMV